MTDIQRSTVTLTLSERLRAKQVDADKCLILDVSGSMSSDCEPGHTKIQALREIVAGIVGNPAVYAFSNSPCKIDKNQVPDPHGSTYMEPAIQLVKSDGFRSAIMITDGEASDKTQVLAAVTQFNLQILYVGPGPKPAFLDELASVAGGYCKQEDLKKPKELTQKVQALLSSGGDTSASNKKGPICL